MLMFIKEFAESFALGLRSLFGGLVTMEEPTRIAIGGYTTRQVADALASMGNAGVTLRSNERTDDHYYEPVAMYPEMTNPEHAISTNLS